VNVDPSPSTVAPDAFVTVVEFADRARLGQLDADDRTIGRSHPLSLVVESTLESLSRGFLTDPIVGFSRRSENDLALARRAIEDEDTQVELQVLLFSFEGLAKAIREAGYGGSDVEADSRFFEQDLPNWLVCFEDWAKATGQDLLARSIGVAHDAFVAIAAKIVKADG
jgi:hypothetical protein